MPRVVYKIKDYGVINGKKLYVMYYGYFGKYAGGAAICLRHGLTTIFKFHLGSFMWYPHIWILKIFDRSFIMSILREIVEKLEIEACREYFKGRLLPDYTECEFIEDDKKIGLIFKKYNVAKKDTILNIIDKIANMLKVKRKIIS